MLVSVPDSKEDNERLVFIECVSEADMADSRELVSLSAAEEREDPLMLVVTVCARVRVCVCVRVCVRAHPCVCAPEPL